MKFAGVGLVSTWCLVAGGILAADDWPQWQGPDRDSVWREQGILERFASDGPNVQWRAKIDGGYAGPAVAAGRVFVADYRTDGDRSPSPSRRNPLQGTERLHCFSAKDGKKLWTNSYDCNYDISYPAGPRATPTVDGDRVYCLGAVGNLKCLNVANGEVIWEKDLKQEYAKESPIWGFASHPLIEEDILYCVAGGKDKVAVAFNKHTGEELWTALSAKTPGYAPPTMISAGKTRQLLIWHAEAINALDPHSGKVYWSHPLQPDYGMSIATPRQSGDLLFVGAMINKSLLLRLGSNAPTAEVVWKGAARVGIGPVNSSPFIDGKHLYGVDRAGDLRCVELSTGKQVWSVSEPITGQRRANSGTAFLVKHEDRFFLSCETGDLVIARLSPEGYEEISRAHLLDPTGTASGRLVVWSHPAFAEKCVFARNDKEIVCVSLAAP